MKIMDFLFGKKPQIFNEKGEVENPREEKVYQEWENRYKEGREYNWRKHSGRIYMEPEILGKKPLAKNKTPV